MALPVSPKDDRADRKQIELLRAAGPARRAQLAMSLSSEVIDLARRGIAAAHPHLSPRELDLKFVEIHYGADLAAKVRRDLDRR
jgi:hypothetical protein